MRRDNDDEDIWRRGEGFGEKIDDEKTARGIAAEKGRIVDVTLAVWETRLLRRKGLVVSWFERVTCS